jgi:hypothetical protein
VLDSIDLVANAPLSIRIAAILILPIAIPVAAIDGLLSKPMRRRRSEVADLLQRRLDNLVGDAEWDEFTCVPISDPQLEAIRSDVTRLENDGKRNDDSLRWYIRQLRRA